MIEPRRATLEETQLLEDYLSVEMGCWHNEADADRVNIQGLMEGAAIAVFDNYITDSPGYTGKVIMVVWPGSPNMYEVFTFKGKELVRVNQDKGFIKEEETLCEGCGEPILEGQAVVSGENRHSACS
jgi:hypothetical protein